MSVSRHYLVDGLAIAEQHVVVGREGILRQRELIRDLDEGGYGKSETAQLAREWLRLLERAYAMHLTDRQRLIAEIFKSKRYRPSASTGGSGCADKAPAQIVPPGQVGGGSAE
jgi:hypothetical protein